MGREILSTVQVRELLKKRYAPTEWVLFEEVRNSTGFPGSERYADAVAMNLYPSKGLELFGFEIKVSRADWKRELANPEKALAVQQYCDRWWVVAGGPNIVNASELPAGWGLMVCSSGRINIVHDAPKLSAKPLDRAFVASMLRNISKNPPVLPDTQVQEAFDRGRASIEEDLEKARQSFDRLNERVRSFEALSSLALNDFNARRVSQAVQILAKAGSPSDPAVALQRSKSILQSSINYIEAVEQVHELIAAAPRLAEVP